MTLKIREARSIAKNTLAAIPANPRGYRTAAYIRYDIDRKRVASDLAGLERHLVIKPHTDPCPICSAKWPCSDVQRYSDGLTLTSSQYL